ncbi:MAG TPA: alpha-hydroxy acid oxidase [Candidatus Angelobacter sp.]|jgi:L-lactate dehydrogenase (cytochrome)|nr:alpha-hydroxy acid oxidase [Candidatus Angelobacter sp.]
MDRRNEDRQAGLASPASVGIDDLRSLACRRLPRVVFDYLDGGAEGEVSLQSNRTALDLLTFRPRYGLAVPDCDLRMRVLGFELSLPVLLAPLGYSSLFHPEGELAAAHAAAAAGTVYILSTLSGQSLEDVKVGCGGPAWYQLYLVGGREVAEHAIERARTAGFSALVITIDSAVPGMRERDLRNGVRELLYGGVVARSVFLGQLLARPGWLARFMFHGGLPRLRNVILPGQTAMTITEAGAALAHAAFVWEDLRWIHELWKGPIVVKGVLTGNDARRAVDEGAHAIIVSNHGGRQLDCVPASLRALPEVVAAIGGQAEILMDGGIRRGSDVIKALCLGARAVLCGRAYAYGLAAAGERGVARTLEILRDDLERTLKLLGCPSIAALDRSYLNIPNHFE